MAPVPEPSVNQVSFPAPFSAVPCHWWDGGEHHLRPWSLNQSPQCLEVPFDGLGTSFCYLVHANLHYQEEVVIRRPHQTREFLSIIPNPGPREEADFYVGWVRSADRALCSPQKGITYDNDPSFFLSRGNFNMWGCLTRSRQPPGWSFTFTHILCGQSLTFQIPISVA